MRRVAWILAAVIAAPLLGLAGGLGWLQTGSGKAWLAHTLGSVLSTPERQVRVGRIDGQVPFDLTLADVALADREGVWLTIDRARLVVDPAVLLHGQLRVTAVEVGSVSVARAPNAQPSSSSAGGLGLPRLPVSVELAHLGIDALHLGAPLLGGAEATVRVEGTAALGHSGERLAATLTVARIDGPPGRLHLEFAYEPSGGRPADDRLAIALTGAEPAGGVIARLAGLTGLPPIDLDLEGSGALAAWSGRMTARAGDAALLSAEAHVRAAEAGYVVSLTAGGRVAGLLAPAWAPLVGDAATLAGEVRINPRQRIELSGPVRLSLAAGTLDLSGNFGLADDRVALTFAGDAGPDSALHGLLALPSWGSAHLAGTVEGPALAPVVGATLTIAGVRSPVASAGSVRLTARATPSGPLTEPKTVLDVTLDAAASDLAMADGALAPLIGTSTTASATAVVERDDGEIRVSGLSLATAGATVSGQSTAHGWGQSGEAKLTLALDDLSRLSDLAGRPFSGAASLTAEVNASAGGKVLGVSLGGAVTAPRTGSAALDALLGERATLAAKVTVDAAGTLRVDDLELAGADATATGHGELAGERVAGAVRLELPRLAALSQALGTPLAGSLTVDAAADGPLAAPRGTLDARAEVRTPAGATRAVSLKTGYAVADGTLTLPDLALVGERDRITGTVAVALNQRLATAQLAGELPDLGILSSLAGADVAGAGRFAATLVPKDGRQDGSLSVELSGMRANGMGGGPLSAGRAVLKADVHDALGSPALTARLEASTVATSGADVASLTVSLDGTLDRAGFALNAEGRVRQPFATALAGAYERKGTDWTVRLDRWSGRFANVPFRLAGPAAAAFGPSRIAVKGLVLESGASRIALDGAVGDRDLAGTARLEAIPAAWASLVEPSLGASGRLDGSATLAGTLADPRGELSLTLADLRLTKATAAGVPGAAVTLAGRWQGGRLVLDGTARAVKGGLDVRARGELPLRLRPRPVALELPQREGIDARVTGTLDLARLNDMLATTGDRLAGRVDLDITASGTLGQPALAGGARIIGGRYENLTTGTVLSDVALRLTGSGDGLAIDSLTARTPNGGTVAASGRIDLGTAATADRLDLRVTAANARLVETDLVTADVAADIAVTGPISRPLIKGQVRVIRADVRAPDRLPPSVIDLHVVKVAGPGTAASAAAPAPAGAGFSADLDVTVVAQGQIFVRGHGLDAELAGAVAATGTTAAPRLYGRLTLVRGQLDLLGKTFQFTRANITFPGGPRLDPELDLLATIKATDVSAEVAVTGTASSPKIELTSNPTLPQDEIMARVLFGKSAGQLSPLEAVQLAQSVADLSGIGAMSGSGLLDTIRRAVGLDRLAVVGGSGTGQPSGVEAGKYLTKNVYVGVRQGIDAKSGGATVQVDLTKSIRAEARMSPNRDTRVGVSFEWDY